MVSIIIVDVGAHAEIFPIAISISISSDAVPRVHKASGRYSTYV